jgi:peptidoglycan hydrolase-like protein with peptidoglycan-binding domain
VRQLARRWVYSAAVAAVGAAACMVGGPAGAAIIGAGQPPHVQTTSGYVPPGKNLYFGNRGPAVSSVQRRLNQLGYFAGPADGQYGYDLEEAVWAFKEVEGLPMTAGNSVITAAFRSALVNPRPPHASFRAGGAGRIEINQNIQVLVLYRDNRPYLILHISSGGGYHFCSKGSCGVAITPDGSYTALSYLPGTITVPLGFMENPIFFIGRSYAIHGGDPVPWYPASHGCVRIYADVVSWFHNDVHIGSTRIYVYGRAPYQPSIVGS